MTTRMTDDIDSREYWVAQDAELEEGLAIDAKLALDPHAILHRLEVQYSATPDTDTQTRQTIQDQIDELAAQIKAAELDRFTAEWTRDVTIARRASWNARAGKGEFSVAGRPSMQLVATAEHEQGWTIRELKAAVAHYGL